MSLDLFIIRCISVALLVATLLAGAYLLKNFQRLFGTDPSLPSENSSARAYNQVQVFSLWAHALFLFGTFAFLLF